MDENSNIDLVTVHESSSNPPEDENGMNGFKNLAIEATLINEFLKEQLINPDEDLDGIHEPNPFSNGEEDQEIEKLAYRYRIFHLVTQY